MLLTWFYSDATKKIPIYIIMRKTDVRQLEGGENK